MENQKRQNFNGKATNALSVGRMIKNTKKNIEEAEIGMEFAMPEELEHLQEKNARRKHSIEIMEKQMRDKAAFKARKKSFE
ncbi:spore protein Tlp [Solibacillus sp. R5-41]|uniref:spore protein Tlp n=1 Tax=Solibacillus sp. R5-41 TaxID=2048654 RepID=UPI000C128F32|nr:spore protein Tlp [Solibacillus sp. R5-41]ATP39520.1 spore protein Tlp [Solibacillus sp. R5-41]